MNPFSLYKESLRQTVLEQTTTQMLFPMMIEHAPCEVISNEFEPDVVYPDGLVLNDDYEEKPYEQVRACVYHLTTTSYGSFVQYLLEVNDGYLSFLEIGDAPGDPGALCQLLGAGHQLAGICFKGYLCLNDTLYIFFQSPIVTSECWVTIDEICNAKRYKTQPVAEAVTEFFVSNPSLLAPASNGEPSDIPVVGSYVRPPQGAILGNVSYEGSGLSEREGHRFIRERMAS